MQDKMGKGKYSSPWWVQNLLGSELYTWSMGKKSAGCLKGGKKKLIVQFGLYLLKGKVGLSVFKMTLIMSLLVHW